MNAFVRPVPRRPCRLLPFQHDASTGRAFRPVRPLIFALLLSHLLAFGSLAIAPPYIPDGELAGYPVIVEAKWEKAPGKSHHQTKGKGNDETITDFEILTRLNVVRVIKGDIKPGVHPLKIGYGISWDKDGKHLSSGTSTEMMGETGMLTNSNLWFLKKEKSWDGSDKKEYLSISNYREIQSLAYEEFYKVIGSPESESKIPGLLASPKDSVVRRALDYVNGNQQPWPYNADQEFSFYGRPLGQVLNGQSKAVLDVVLRKDLKDERGYAAAIYDSMEGSKALPFVRGLLSDPDATVRAVAAALLARHKDSASIEGIISAISGKENGRLGCRLVDALAAWGDIRTVPALAACLENGNSVYRSGDDLGLPCVKARDALHAITGHWFPYHVAPSLAAWKKAAALTNPDARRLELEKTLPCDPSPLAVVLKTSGPASGECTITNKSPRQVVISRLPDDVDVRWELKGSSSFSGAKATEKIPAKEKVIVLEPGKSFQFNIELDHEFLQSSPGSRELNLVYSSLSSQPEAAGWVGMVVADIQ